MLIPQGVKSCPECGSGQNLAVQDDDFSFTRPSDVGVGVEDEPVSDNFFMSGTAQGVKKGNNCPVCGNPMQFKERVNSYFCQRCKSFF